VTQASFLAINNLKLQKPSGQAALAPGLSFAFFEFVSMFVAPPAPSGAAL
jgi:hypothetical protein